ncbi:MAG: family 20 glycosylhydrolase [Acidimicrobiales bacterium]
MAPDRRRVPDRPPDEGLDPTLPPQGYRLEVGEDGVRSRGADEAGLRHARATLAQLRHDANAPDGRAGATLPACRIEDWPDFSVRGVMLDVSRDRVPTLATLFALVERLAGWKVNQVQLYMEHTFAYARHEEVWRLADPFTAEDVHALDAHCRSLGVELVANQNTLGHFERWLRHERYRALAIAPDGFDWVFGIHRPPLTLDPAKPGSLELVTDLLGQLVPAVTSSRVHVGLDEPWELPAERHGDWATWLAALRDLDELDGRELLVWGDVLAAHPDLIAALPDDVTVCEWGYEDDHPFDERASRLAAAGVPFWMSPGTSSWLSVTGRVDNMLGNVSSAARAGLTHGAAGLLVTDWGDMGHHQQPPVSDPGLAVAAAFGWCVDAHADLDTDGVAALLDAHCYDDPTGETGRAVVALGRTPRMVTPRPPNMSALAVHLLLPQWKVGSGLTGGLEQAELDRVEGLLDDTLARLGRAAPRRRDGALVIDEVRATAALARLSCHDAAVRLAGDGTLAGAGAERRGALDTELSAYVAEHRRLWLARHRPGGLDDSTAWFDHLAQCYRDGDADRSWFGPFG